MTATIEPTIIEERLPSASARLSLAPTGSVPALLDGAWWPRSRDLLREIPTLTNALDVCWGRITHVTVNPAHWPVIPRKVPVILLSYTVGRLDLLVILPETEPAAARLMAAAHATAPKDPPADAARRDHRVGRRPSHPPTRRPCGAGALLAVDQPVLPGRSHTAGRNPRR